MDGLKDERIDRIDQLYEAVQKYQECNAFKELRKMICNFPRLSPYNAMMVAIQKPGSSYVASMKTWHNMFGRHVKPDARPLIILRNFGPIDFVYEYNDTEGPEIDKSILDVKLLYPFETNQVITESQYANFIVEMMYDGILYEEKDYGTDLAARIYSYHGTQFLPHGARGKIKEAKVCAKVDVQKNLKTTAKFASILHELGHFYCGHLGRLGTKFLPERYDNPSEDTKEFEAETVAWLCCERLGIKNPSKEYLASYTQDGNIPPVMISAILKAAGNVERLIRGKATLRKELQVKHSMDELLNFFKPL